MRLLPQAALEVSFAATPAASTPCDPIVQGGYLGAENQLIRLQISGNASQGKGQSLLWGYDDASFLYRVSPKPVGQTLLLNQAPVDAFHCPATNQVVEVLRSAVILDTNPDATDPTGDTNIVRCVAEATGFVTTRHGPSATPTTRCRSLQQFRRPTSTTRTRCSCGSGRASKRSTCRLSR